MKDENFKSSCHGRRVAMMVSVVLVTREINVRVVSDCGDCVVVVVVALMVGMVP